MICQRCHAGQMVEYRREVGGSSRRVTLTGRECNRCGYVELENDDDIWSVTGP